MRDVSGTRLVFTVWLAVSVMAVGTGVAQSSASQVSELPIRATLVQSPEFCATKMPKGGRVDVGRLACVDFEPALRQVFPRLTVAAEVPKESDAELILIPTFVDLAATTGVTASSDRKLDIYLQWTAKDSSGRTLWIETVQGSANHRAGTLFTYSKNFKLMVKEAIEDLASNSAAEMSASPELRKLPE